MLFAKGMTGECEMKKIQNGEVRLDFLCSSTLSALKNGRNFWKWEGKEIILKAWDVSVRGSVFFSSKLPLSTYWGPASYEPWGNNIPWPSGQIGWL